jgi:alkanesulfonate monooxygenase SsuD/methylene tetrahydromethanopterin reductase-like flavin-dependent oxidoreductase (luciferase family)
MDDVTVAFVLRGASLSNYADRAPKLMQRIERAGLDGVVVGDHVSFQGGDGVDGLVQAAALVGAHPTLPVETGIYLLPLRHPVLVARQLATIAMIAPTRFAFGVGVGGEDPHEFEICGVDPRTRGARANEALPLIRRLLSGEPVTHHGSFYSFADAVIAGSSRPAIPILVGGRSSAALIRAARHGDGWIALWVSAQRYVEGISMVEVEAESAGRGSVPWRHEYQSWCFFGPRRALARERAATVLGASYDLPFERFERYTPCGTPEDVADTLHPYLSAGCRRFNLVGDAPSLEAAIEDAGQVKRLLQAAVA